MPDSRDRPIPDRPAAAPPPAVAGGSGTSVPAAVPRRRDAVAHVLRARLPGRQLVVVSNREPYVHRRTPRGLEVERPPGGLVEALDPVMQALGGVWVAWGSGSGDREAVDVHDRVAVPPEAPRYLLRRVWLPERVVETSYYGYANQALWPLCHLAVTKARFLRRYWEGYVEANRLFASAAAEEAEPRAFVWAQDYHLALFPALLRAQRPDLFLAHFWHIPWPAWDVFRAMPAAQRAPLLRGLLGNDLLGFHLERFRETFLECVEQELPDADVDFANGVVDLEGHRTTVRVFPISIDVERFEELAASPAGRRWMARWRARPEVGDRAVVAGVDRLDYSKGIPERLRAVDRFLRRHPEWRDRVVFVQKAAPTRTRIKAYQELQAEVERLVGEINARYGTPAWTPVLYLPEPMPRVAVAALYRLADVAVVSSLQDGMNLVAKEFIAAQVDERGVLLLSELSGAAEELAHALIINPYDEEGFAEALRGALEMPLEERRARLRSMRAYLRQHDVYWWMEEIVAAAARLIARRQETRHLFGDLPRLRALFQRRRPALFLDYDGTLVPIAPRPADAMAGPEVRQVLQALVAAGIEVAIVTGRAIAEIRRLLGVEGVLYFGNHGLEVEGPAQPPVAEAAERLRGQIRDLTTQLREALAEIPGVIVEEKGFGSSVHYRLVAPEQVDRVKQVVGALVARARPWVRLTRGKKVLELRLSLPWDKGRAVLWWLHHRYGPEWDRRVVPIYIGDDRTDEDAFGALLARGVTVTVAPEAPTAAAYYLRDPEEVLAFLRDLPGLTAPEPAAVAG